MEESKMQQSSHIRREIKAVFCGDSSKPKLTNSEVGKTSIILRLMSEEIDSVKPTIGVDFIRKDVYRQDYHYSIQLWDTAGQEKFDGLTKLHFMDANVVIIVVDISNEVDLRDQAERWMGKVKGCTQQETSIFGLLTVSGFFVC
jgi:small GTP-binding protein